jgi:hypothetical protein
LTQNRRPCAEKASLGIVGRRGGDHCSRSLLVLIIESAEFD